MKNCFANNLMNWTTAKDNHGFFLFLQTDSFTLQWTYTELQKVVIFNHCVSDSG